MLESLLSEFDPEPVEVINRDGRAPVLLTCEHAGRALPERLGDLGVASDDLARHIGWDIGAESLARQLAVALDAPLVVQRYSRLVVDCNRPLHAPSCVPEHSDGTVVPANVGLSQQQRQQRFDAIHVPYHDTVDTHLRERAPELLLPVHSFTPHMNGEQRPWHAGLLHGNEVRGAHAMMAALRRAAPSLERAFNEPYRVDHASDYTIPVHGEGSSVAHVLLEVRNDLIADEAGIAHWSGLLEAAVRATIEALGASAGESQ